jgi:hypothetical protein
MAAYVCRDCTIRFDLSVATVTKNRRCPACGSASTHSFEPVPKEEIATIRLAPGAQANMDYVDFDGVEIVAERGTKVRGRNIRTRRVNTAINATDADVSMTDWEVDGPDRG